MQAITDYIEKAKKKIGTSSDRELARFLGLNPSICSVWRTGKNPSEKVMIELANLAGVTKEQALLELSYWKADGEAKNTYSMLLKRLVSGVALCAFFLGSTPYSAKASDLEKCHNGSEIIYIMETIRSFYI